MNYHLVVDLEATCWEHVASPNGSTIVEPEMEIIEIGAVMLDEQFNVIDEFQTFVKPIVTEKLSAFCKNLTHISDDDVSSAPYFKSALLNFLAWIGDRKPFTFYSHGNYDRDQFQKDCARHGIEYPFTNHVNLKELFSKKTGVKYKNTGLGNCLRLLNLTFEGSKHRGIDDARNIAKIAKILLSSEDAINLSGGGKKDAK